jgi:hypothetical protein
LPGEGTHFRHEYSRILSWSTYSRAQRTFFAVEIATKKICDFPYLNLIAIGACFGSALPGFGVPDDEGWNVIDY